MLRRQTKEGGRLGLLAVTSVFTRPWGWKDGSAVKSSSFFAEDLRLVPAPYRAAHNCQQLQFHAIRLPFQASAGTSKHIHIYRHKFFATFNKGSTSLAHHPAEVMEEKSY